MPLDMELEAQVPNQRYAGDSKLFVVFYMKAVKNGFKSEQEGRPIFDDVPHIRIYTPGDKTNVTILRDEIGIECNRNFDPEIKIMLREMDSRTAQFFNWKKNAMVAA